MGIYTSINIIEMVLIKKTYYQVNITVDYEPSLILRIYCNYGRPLKKINVDQAALWTKMMIVVRRKRTRAVKHIQKYYYP